MADHLRQFSDFIIFARFDSAELNKKNFTSFFPNILALEHSKPKSKTPFTTCNDSNQDPYCLCPSGQRISVFKSHHHNPNEDRIWQLECAPIQLVKIEESQAKLYIPSKY